MKLIQQYVLNRKYRLLRRKVRVVNLSNTKSALIVYNASSQEHEKKVRDLAHFFKEEGIKTESIGFYQKKNKQDQRPVDELGYHYFDKTELNWLKFPTSKVIKKLIATEFHLLIDLNLENNFGLQFISSLSKANFKVGIAGEYQSQICDLTLSTSKRELDYLIEQMKIYLTMINNK